MKTNRLALTIAVSSLVAASASAAITTNNWFTANVSTYPTGWTTESFDGKTVDATGTEYDSENGVLKIDVADGTLNWAAPSATEAAGTKTILTIPTKFVAATELPTVGSLGDAQAAVVVCETNNANVYYGYSSGVARWVALSGTPDLTQTVNLKLVFNYDLATPTVQFYVGATELTATETTFYLDGETAVLGLGFSGTGEVANFGGEYVFDAFVPKASVDGGSTNTESQVKVRLSGTTLTSNFAASKEVSEAQKTLAFVRVWDDDGNFVTKRTSSASQTIDVSKLEGDVEKVVAFYGDVSAIPTGMDRPTASGIVVGVSDATVTVPGLKSGLYYKIVSGGSKVGEAQLIDPANDGESTTFTVSKPATGWGAVTFKVVASDDAN